MAFNLSLPPSSQTHGKTPAQERARFQVNGARYELKVATSPGFFASSRFGFAASAFGLIVGSGLLGFQFQPTRTHLQYDMTPTGSIGAKIDPVQAKARACN